MERDGFWTPALQQETIYAPLFGFSNQALWSSMVFPTEYAMLEAFVVTYDEMGLDDVGEINPFFVEWVTAPPSESEGAAATRVHERLKDLSAEWHVDHPCWVPGPMPAMHHDPSAWPPAAASALLGAPSGP